MGLLRYSNDLAVTPSPNLFPPAEFLQSQTEEILTPVYDKSGNKIRDLKETRVVKKSISSDSFHNKGLTTEMFRLDNLIAAGIPLTLVTKPLIGADLDVKGAVTDYVEGVDYQQLFEDKSNNNNNQNE